MPLHALYRSPLRCKDRIVRPLRNRFFPETDLRRTIESRERTFTDFPCSCIHCSVADTLGRCLAFLRICTFQMIGRLASNACALYVIMALPGRVIGAGI